MKLKKVFLPFVIIFLLLFLSLFLFSKPKEEEKKEEKKEKIEKKQENTMKKYSFYKSENESRYLAYKKKNKTLSEEDIIVRVNIGLDQPYYTNTQEAPFLNTPYTLVNKYYYLREDFLPDNLEELSEEYSKGGIYLVKEARDAFVNLVIDAKKENLTIRAISAYRGYTYQENLYHNYVLQDGVELADTYSARPGFSDHQTGLAVDIDNTVVNYNNFDTTKEFTWMMEHMEDYGFILRYPKGKENITGYRYESWHYRYVGCDIAKKIKASGLTFDEYYMKYIDS